MMSAHVINGQPFNCGTGCEGGSADERIFTNNLTTIVHKIQVENTINLL